MSKAKPRQYRQRRNVPPPFPLMATLFQKKMNGAFQWETCNFRSCLNCAMNSTYLFIWRWFCRSGESQFVIKCCLALSETSQWTTLPRIKMRKSMKKRSTSQQVRPWWQQQLCERRASFVTMLWVSRGCYLHDCWVFSPNCGIIRLMQ